MADTRVQRRIREAVAEGESAMKEAEELIKFAKRAGIDVSAQETELQPLEEKLSTFKKALKE